MALYATNRFPGDGSTTSYEFNFVGKYISRSHVKVYQEDNATKVRTYVSINDGNFLNDTTLRNLPVTPSGYTLVICRETPKPPLVDFVNGSRFTEYNLDLVARQGLFVAMEALDSNGHEAIGELLAAIEVVVGLVNQATAAVADATAAALAAAGSAADALGYRNAAQAAQTAAETARNAAQASAGTAATSATNAGNSATAAASSASAAATSESNAAASASTATTQAGLAGGYSVSANNSANNAATRATAALNAQTAAENARDVAIAAKNSGMHCKLVWSTVNYIVGLVRWGGKTMIINGEARDIPAGGVTITIPNDSSVRNVYAYWNGSAIALEQSTTVPVWLDSQGYWVKTGDASRTYLGSARGDGLVAGSLECCLRSAWNERTLAYRKGITQQNSGTWAGNRYQLAYGGFIALPGDTLEITGNVNIMTTPANRVGDFNIGMFTLGWELAKDRKSFPNASHWNGFFAEWKGMRDIKDQPVWIDPYAEFWAISANSGYWNTLGPASDMLFYGAEPAF